MHQATSDLGTFGERVRWFRLNRKWNQIEMARRLDINQSSLSRIEAGILKPNPDLRSLIDGLLADFDKHDQSEIDVIVGRVVNSSELRALVMRIHSEIIDA